MTLQGASGLRSRLRALRRTVSVENRKWGKEVVAIAKPKTPVRTGTLRRSYRVQASQKRGRVLAWYTAYFIDAGVVRHVIQPRHARGLAFKGRSGRTVFAKKVNHPGFGARPFRAYAANEGMRRTNPVQTIVDLWNNAD